MNHINPSAQMMRIHEAGDPTVAAYLETFKKVFASDEKRFLHDFDEADLIERKAWLVPALVHEDAGLIRTIGGFHFVIDGMRTAYVQGVVLDPEHRHSGMMGRLLTQTFNNLFELDAIDSAALVVRVLPDGTVNEKAYRLFSTVGFSAISVEEIAICGKKMDRHFFLSAEPNGRTYRVLRMRGGKTELAKSLTGTKPCT